MGPAPFFYMERAFSGRLSAKNGEVFSVGRYSVQISRCRLDPTFRRCAGCFLEYRQNAGFCSVLIVRPDYGSVLTTISVYPRTNFINNTVIWV